MEIHDFGKKLTDILDEVRAAKPGLRWLHIGDGVGGDQVTEDVIIEGEAILFVTFILHI